MSIKAREFVVVDLETTGLNAEDDEIIEIAGVKLQRGILTEEFHSLVQCKKSIPKEVSVLTGIDNAMLVDAPRLEDVLADFSAFVGDAELVAHNANFDRTFLIKYWPDERLWLDTLTLSQIVFPTESSYSLTSLTASLAITNETAHRALSDARAEAELFIKITDALTDLPPQAKEDILKLCEEDNTPMGQLLRRRCQMPGEGKDEKQSLERRSRQRVIHENYVLDLQELEDYLGSNSKYQQRLDNFEARPQQLQLSQAVGETFNRRGCLLAEAGTGTGKSLAYLLPAALYAAGSGRQIAISTHTRNLQEQLLNKDIPMLGKLLDRPVAAAVLKGRSNYLCRRLYGHYLEQSPENMRYFLMRIAVWRAISKTGDGGELCLTAYDRWKWQRICASRENCADFCPFAKKNGCLVQRARAKAAEADILILNHSLLVANAAIEKGFLPDLPFLVIDEAQHLEHAAEDQLSSRIDIFALVNMAARLKRKEKKREAGAIAQLGKYAQDVVDGNLTDTILKSLEEIDASVDRMILTGEQFFTALSDFFLPDVGKETFFPAKIRIRSQHRGQVDWPLLHQLGDGLTGELMKLSSSCFRLLDVVLGYAREEDETARPAGCDELQVAASEAREMASTLLGCLDEHNEDYVTWVEYIDREKRPSLNMAPIEIGQLLYDCLYQDVEAIVFTSATLAAGKDFSYFKHRHGLDLLAEKPRELMMLSPFHYQDQAVFTIVNDLPDWSRCPEVTAVEMISRALIRLLAASNGRAIVLFTSHYQLKAVYQRVQKPLAEQGVTVLAHGISGDPSSLLYRLRREEKCCILGANSFWEGVDVIGDALSLIVVVRLPFWPPNTPIAACRMERIEAEGKSSFNDYSLPQALIRFKQGFGRLIRSHGDQGVFCVLDKRIIEKTYGRKFIQGLPDMRRIVGSVDEIAAVVEKWLK